MPSEGRRARLLLVGQGPTAAAALASLLAQHDVIGLIRAADDQDDVTRRARAAGVVVHGEAKLAVLEAVIEDRRPDAVVVSSFDRVLPAALLRTCPFVNVHYSPLPRYRGRANVNWAVINGEPAAAISIHELVPDLDAGGVLYQEEVTIGPRTTATSLYAALNDIQERELGAAVSRLLAGDHGVEQDETQATYGCTRVPDDGELDWTASTVTLDRLVRGLTPPAPGAFTHLGLERLWVDRAEPVDDPPSYEGRIPGRVVRVARDAGWVDVLTGDGVLRLLEVRLEDGCSVQPSTVCRSVKTTLGLRATDLVAELLDLRRQLASVRSGSEPSA